MEQIRNPLNSWIKSVVGATLVVARMGHAVTRRRDGTSPSPTIRCSLRVRGPAAGWKLAWNKRGMGARALASAGDRTRLFRARPVWLGRSRSRRAASGALERTANGEGASFGRGRPGYGALAATIMALAACSSTPVSSIGALDSRLVWPCDRLIVEWAVDAGHLQRMVGESPRVRRIEDAGRVQLHVMHCQPTPPATRDSEALAYAYVLVPVSGDSAAVRITRMASDGWYSLLQAVASENSPALFQDFHFDVIVAAQDFVIDEEDDETSISVRLTFDNGHLSIDANTVGPSTAYAASTALLGSGDGYHFAYFGEEASLRYPAFAAVRVVGETPLSPFDLPEAPAATTFDRGLVSDRVYWRVPTTPKETGARNPPYITPQSQ